MAQVILLFELCEVVLLERMPLRLIGGGVGMAWIAWQVELIESFISRKVLADDNDPGPFLLLVCVEKLKLRVGDTAVLWIDFGGLGTIALAHQLDEAFASIELFAEPLAQFAIAGGKVVLRDGIEPERADRPGHSLPGGPQLLTDSGKKHTRSVHRSPFCI